MEYAGRTVESDVLLDVLVPFVERFFVEDVLAPRIVIDGPCGGFVLLEACFEELD